MQKADEPRLVRLREAKSAATKAPKKPRTRTWKKRCPKCGTQVHVRREACECGFKFTRR